METITVEFVKELIDFNGLNQDGSKPLPFAESQYSDTVAAFNMLSRNNCAYIANEVGTGKTFVALGVMCLLRYFNPHARVIVIAPRENIQRKWEKELKNFVGNHWKNQGNRVKSLDDNPVWPPVVCDRLLTFAREVQIDQDRDFFLRMTSFSLRTSEEDDRKKASEKLREQVPWIESVPFKTAEAFKDEYALALNRIMPELDLVIVDEAHNLKHGFNKNSSTRNHVMGIAFGRRPFDESIDREWRGENNAKRVLFLSATPFEDDYVDIWHQLSIFGFGNAKLKDMTSDSILNVSSLKNENLDSEKKHEVVERLMIRRVSGLEVSGKFHTRNMYRREWRAGGFDSPDDFIEIKDNFQLLTLGLIQKKVAEILQSDRFNNRFQIGMLSSFESFSQTMKSEFYADDQQGGVKYGIENEGIDTDAIKSVAESYKRNNFGNHLPHPKLDETVKALWSAFVSGEKTLVFVRRIATVNELARRLNEKFDIWIKQRMKSRLPTELHEEFETIFGYYEKEVKEEDSNFEIKDSGFQKEDDPESMDRGGNESFFSWFFRGDGPKDKLSGTAFRRNRLSRETAYATLFEEDYLARLLGRNTAEDVFSELANLSGKTFDQCKVDLRNYAIRMLSQSKDQYTVRDYFEAYQTSGLKFIDEHSEDHQPVNQKANIILRNRFDNSFSSPQKPSAEHSHSAISLPESSIGFSSIFTELRKNSELHFELFPNSKKWSECSCEEFEKIFLEDERRRQLFSSIMRFGVTYVDLYLLAIKRFDSFESGQSVSFEISQSRTENLAKDFVGLLDEQKNSKLPTSVNSYYELTETARAFDCILSVNFPDFRNKELTELREYFRNTLQSQVPIGEISGGVNERLVRQFRMPGFPFVLIATDVLREGEDLHTFCKNIVHYGIAWTPSAIEQRIGRVDRINGLVQRQLSDRKKDDILQSEEKIQVYYPYLVDTVEFLQVKRVLERLDNFLKLIYRSSKKDEESSIDTGREMLKYRDLEVPRAIEHELTSAFPIKSEWLDGTLDQTNVKLPEIELLEDHLNMLIENIRKTLDKSIVFTNLAGRGSYEGEIKSSYLYGSNAKQSVSETEESESFRLNLRSQVSGDETLLECRAKLGAYEFESIKGALLENAKKNKFFAKLCLSETSEKKKRTIYVRRAILFDREATTMEDVLAMINDANRFKVDVSIELNGKRKSSKKQSSENHLATDRTSLQEMIESLVHRDGSNWCYSNEDKTAIRVRLGGSGRSRFQVVKCVKDNSRYRFSSVVFFKKPMRTEEKYQLLHQCLERNAHISVVNFQLKGNEVVGVIEQPISSAHENEVKFYIDILAKECDRFEYVLTGNDEN